MNRQVEPGDKFYRVKDQYEFECIKVEHHQGKVIRLYLAYMHGDCSEIFHSSFPNEFAWTQFNEKFKPTLTESLDAKFEKMRIEAANVEGRIAFIKDIYGNKYESD